MLPEVRPRLFRCACVALLLAALDPAALPAAAQSGGVLRTPEVPGDKRPAVLERVLAPAGLLAFAISRDGEQAVLASESSTKPDQSDLLWFSTALDEPRSTRLPGRVRDLLFATDGSVLYGILHRVAKRTGGDTHLVLIDPVTLKMKRANRLPVGATDLDHWVTARALLIAAPSEIRTLLLPDLRSGPLFPVTGTNRAVASLGGSSLVLVGQEDGLDLVDLEDRPGIEEMPVREHLRTNGPVEGLAAATDGNSALARLAGGDLYTVRFGPLRLRPAGRAAGVAAPPVAAFVRSPVVRLEDQRPAPAAPADREDTKPAEPPPVALSPPAHEDQAAPDPRLPTTPPPTAVEPVTFPGPATPATPPPEPAPRAAPEKPEVKPDAPSPPASAPPAAKSDAQVSGRITGAAVGLARFVVLLGPNNLLREATRVAPGADGGWGADGLAVGRYRVQLDGGSGRVLDSRPPYVIVDIIEGQRTSVPDIEVVREF